MPALLLLAALAAAPAAEGFYRDLFMDGGTGLTHRVRLYAADSLGLDYEYLARDDSALMRHVMVANPDDANGSLLYPDGAPRFRVIYTNGGDAGRHGRALGPDGRRRIRDFHAGGGSYSGSCAGAYLASLSNQDSGTVEVFYHIWPGRVRDTGLRGVTVGNTIPADSPLLDYHDFGGDRYIDSLYVNGGPWANETIDWPAGTAVLSRYDTLGHACHDRPATWSRKAADTTGRIVLLGTHPEGWPFGERLQLMKACLAYALAGVARPRPKAALANRVTRAMDQPTGGDPLRARIGDRQYHHFTLDLDPGATGLAVAVAGDDSFRFNLYLDPDSLAFASSARWRDTTPGARKNITVPFPVPGRWHVGVELATTVTTYGDSCFLYAGPVRVLDGIAYDITAGWDTSAAVAGPAVAGGYFRVAPVIFRDECRIDLAAGARVAVYSAAGRLIASDRRPAGMLARTAAGRLFRPGAALPAGVYLLRITTEDRETTARVILAR